MKFLKLNELEFTTLQPKLINYFLSNRIRCTQLTTFLNRTLL